MQFVDLAAQQLQIKDKIDANIQSVLAHGKYIMGPEVSELEKRLAEYVGCKYAVGCASGTDALLMALMALDVGPCDAVFTTPFTFIATAEVVSLLGATPVFVDIDPQTFNIDPRKLEQAILAVKSDDPSIHPLPSTFSLQSSALTPKCIIPVDLFGLLADYDAIDAIAVRYGLSVIEDAAQSFGAEYKGKKACTFGNIACTSFFPAKPLGCYGDGGMCFTNDAALAVQLESIRVHGKGATNTIMLASVSTVDLTPSRRRFCLLSSISSSKKLNSANKSPKTTQICCPITHHPLPLTCPKGTKAPGLNIQSLRKTNQNVLHCWKNLKPPTFPRRSIIPNRCTCKRPLPASDTTRAIFRSAKIVPIESSAFPCILISRFKIRNESRRS